MRVKGSLGHSFAPSSASDSGQAPSPADLAVLDDQGAVASGGEQQRVAIARAIVNQPKVLFADEPTGNLDSATSAQIMEILLGLATEHGVTLIVVTHDQSLAARGDRTLVIKDGKISG